jgi:hypothetical protein
MLKNRTLKGGRREKRKRTKKTFKRKKIKKPNCAPNPNPNKTLDFTCYTNEGLYKLRDLWNARHPDVKINESNPKDIWEKLNNYMSGSCSNEKCWLEQSFIKEKLDRDILNNTFAPEAPKEWETNPLEWLSSLDIINVMKQYEKKYRCFEFMGPSPIDYDTHKMFGECVWEELCHFNLEEQIKKKKNKIGIIFNLDPHYKPGSHWVALFINIKKGKIYFSDSYGIKPHKQIYKFIKNVIKQGKNLGIDFVYEYNKLRHQYSDSECGMYSLHFIIQCLKDLCINDLFNKRINDKQMMKLRKIYFNG